MNNRRAIAATSTILLAWEGYLVLLLAWLAFISVPIYLNRLGLSWDTLNHHIYLGWVADHARFDKDYMAASLQSYQYPYLYWPVYKLAAGGASGVVAGVVLASLHLVTVPPVWICARLLIPDATLQALSLRLAAVALAFMTALAMKTFETTANDLLAAAPLLWAIALSLTALNAPADDGPIRFGQAVTRASLISGLLAGLSIAGKLSNGPLAVLLPLVFLFCAGSAGRRLTWLLLNGLAIVVGFVVAYGYWGSQLWSMFGNPIHPFADGIFQHLRSFTGWQP